MDFNNIPVHTAYNVKKVYDADPDVATPARKMHKVCKDRTSPDIIHRIQEVINEDPGKSMHSIARELQMSDITVRRIVAEEIRYRSYVLRRGQFMTKERLFEKARKLLTKLKNPKEAKPLIFFSDEKNFQHDQMVNRRNSRWLCENPDEVPIVMKTKFPAAVMVLSVVSNKGDIMIPHFFP